MGKYLDKIRQADTVNILPSVPIHSDISDKSCSRQNEDAGVRESTEGDKRDKSDEMSGRSGVVIEPAVRPDGRPLSPVYWESTDGRMHGPCPVTEVAQADGRFWLIVEEQGLTVWVHESRLRSRAQAERHVAPIEQIPIAATLTSPVSVPPQPKRPARRNDGDDVEGRLF